MKKLVKGMIALTMMGALFGCSTSKKEQTTLTVFAAASMTESLDKVIAAYTKDNPDVTINVNYGSSGDLETQIKEGEDVDLFISAGQKQMNEIEAGNELNTDGSDYVLEGTRVNFLENKVVLCVSDTNKVKLDNFDDLANALKEGSIVFAMGNVASVPVGQYTEQILQHYELDHAQLANDGKITYCEDVKAVTTAIIECNVNCGIIYATDAYSANLTPKCVATTDLCKQIIYPAAIMKNSKNVDATKAFMEYLLSDKAMAEFETVGFTKVKE
mgnify:CR=1 FL=1